VEDFLCELDLSHAFQFSARVRRQHAQWAACMLAVCTAYASELKMPLAGGSTLSPVTSKLQLGCPIPLQPPRQWVRVLLPLSWPGRPLSMMGALTSFPIAWKCQQVQALQPLFSSSYMAVFTNEMFMCLPCTQGTLHAIHPWMQLWCARQAHELHTV